MDKQSEDLMPPVAKALRSAAEYYYRFIEGIDNYIAYESTFVYLDIEFQVSFNGASGFSYGYTLHHSDGSQGLEGLQLTEALDFIAARMPLPPPSSLPERFDFTFCFKGEPLHARGKLISHSLSDFLSRESSEIRQLVEQRMQQQKLSVDEKTIFELSFDFGARDGNCVILKGEPNPILERIILEATRARADKIRPGSGQIPSFIQLRFLAMGSSFTTFFPYLPTVDSNPKLASNDENLSASEAALNRIEPYRRRFKKHPDHPLIALIYYQARANCGEAVSKDCAFELIESARDIVRQNPGISHVHEIFAGLLSGYSETYNCRDQYFDEVIQELRLARELNTAKIEVLTQKITVLLVMAGRHEEALSELMSESFRTFRLPPHLLCFSYLHQIADICETVGDMEPARVSIEEAISQLGGKPEAHWQSLNERCQKKML